MKNTIELKLQREFKQGGRQLSSLEFVWGIEANTSTLVKGVLESTIRVSAQFSISLKTCTFNIILPATIWLGRWLNSDSEGRWQGLNPHLLFLQCLEQSLGQLGTLGRAHTHFLGTQHLTRH